MKKKKNQKNKGFTLIETFVAITILLISILGPLSAVAKFYADNTYARHQIAAAFLAQDGLESSINIWENHKLKYQEESPGGCDVAPLGYEWLGPLRVCKDGCNPDSLSGEIVTGCDADDGCPVYKPRDENADQYFYASSDPSRIPSEYTRLIKVENIEADDPDNNPNLRAAKITATVKWKDKGKPARPVVIETRIIQNPCQ